MAYTLYSVTIRTDDTAAGRQKTAELWRDVAAGKLPILFDSKEQFRQGISPVTRYSNYGPEGCDLTILGVEGAFFRRMEREAATGQYRKYETTGEGDALTDCSARAWALVRREEKSGAIRRAFTEDYESVVPAEYTKDGRPHCYLYIALRRKEESGSR